MTFSLPVSSTVQTTPPLVGVAAGTILAEARTFSLTGTPNVTYRNGDAARLWGSTDGGATYQPLVQAGASIVLNFAYPEVVIDDASTHYAAQRIAVAAGSLLSAVGGSGISGGGPSTLVDQGMPAPIANAWPVEVTDGVTIVGVAPANTVAVAGVGAAVVALSPSTPLPAGANALGSVSVSNFPAVQPVSGTVAVSNFPATQPVSGTVTADQGSAAALAGGWPVKVTDGASVLGTAGAPLRIDPTGTTTQPVSATSLPLPTNAAQEAGGHLASIDAKVPPLGQALAAASVPAVLPAAQETSLRDVSDRAARLVGHVTVDASALPTGAATAAAQTDGTQKTQVTVLPSIPAGANTIGKVDQGVGGASAWKVDGSAVVQPVSGTVSVSNFPATQAVSSAQLPAALVGGRLDTNNGAWLGSTAPTVGQKTSANSLPVVIASDQSAVPVTASGTVTANQGTAAAIGAPWPTRLSDGTNPLGTDTNPLVTTVPPYSRTTFASVHGVVTGLFSSAFGYSVSRTTSTPTGGSAISPFKRLSSDPAPIAVFRASPTATAAAGPAKTRSPGVLLGLSVTGSFVCPPFDLLLALREVDAVVLAPGDGLLIHAAANSAGWTHFADFEVVSG